MDKNTVIETASFSLGSGSTYDCPSSLMSIVECARSGIPTAVFIRPGESDLLVKGLIAAGMGVGMEMLDAEISPSEFSRLMKAVGVLYDSSLVVIETGS